MFAETSGIWNQHQRAKFTEYNTGVDMRSTRRFTQMHIQTNAPPRRVNAGFHAATALTAPTGSLRPSVTFQRLAHEALHGDLVYTDAEDLLSDGVERRCFQRYAPLKPRL